MMAGYTKMESVLQREAQVRNLEGQKASASCSTSAPGLRARRRMLSYGVWVVKHLRRLARVRTLVLNAAEDKADGLRVA